MGNKNSFVIDECCIKHAARMIDEDNLYDITSLNMIINIAHHCDKLVTNCELLTNYREVISELERERNKTFFVILNVLNNLVPNQSKLIYWEDDLYSIPHDNELPPDDIYLVRLARISQSTLVTSDKRLIGKIEPNENGFSQKYQIRVLTPIQVIEEIASNITS